MLTAEHLRATVRKGQIYPRFIDPKDEGLLSLAQELIRIFGASLQETRRELDEQIDDLVGDEARVAIIRGLVKLLDRRSEWETVAPMDPVELRRLVFEASAAAHPLSTRASRRHQRTRQDVLQELAAQLQTTPQAIEEGLYADLHAEQRMTRFRAVEPEALLHRYNVAQVQGLLLRAHSMVVNIQAERAGTLRQLYRALKFHQLMHRTLRDGDHWQITIDGPMSLFGQVSRYGLQMANFLPTLMLAPCWSLQAQIDWPRSREPLRLELDSRAGLVTHARARGTWISEEERSLSERIDKDTGPWERVKQRRIIDLKGQDVFIPDLTLRHRLTGAELFIEIIGFWRAAYLQQRASMLAQHGPSNLLLCVSRKLLTDDGIDFEELQGQFLDFANIIPLGKVIEAADRLGK